MADVRYIGFNTPGGPSPSHYGWIGPPPAAPLPPPPPPAPAPNPPQLQFTFDTIAQVIPRTIGHCRMPLKPIWVLGIDASGQFLDGSVVTYDAPIGSTSLSFSGNPAASLPGHPIPSWVCPGITVTGSEAIPPDTVTTSVSPFSVTLGYAPGDPRTYPGLLTDLPAGTVVFFFSQATCVTDVDLPKDTTHLTFVTGTVPAFVHTLPGVGVTGEFIPIDTSVLTATDSSADISHGLEADLPAGAKIVFSKGVTTVTFAAALCAPWDPDEEGGIAAFYSGSNQIFNPSIGVVPPPGMSFTDQQQLIDSLSRISYYPGTEGQFPDPQIAADRGAAFTPGFRGLRYLIIPEFPISGGFANLSVIFRRSNPIAGKATAVEFAAGAG